MARIREGLFLVAAEGYNLRWRGSGMDSLRSLRRHERGTPLAHVTDRSGELSCDAYHDSVFISLPFRYSAFRFQAQRPFWHNTGAVADMAAVEAADTSAVAVADTVAVAPPAIEAEDVRQEVSVAAALRVAEAPPGVPEGSVRAVARIVE